MVGSVHCIAAPKQGLYYGNASIPVVHRWGKGRLGVETVAKNGRERIRTRSLQHIMDVVLIAGREGWREGDANTPRPPNTHIRPKIMIPSCNLKPRVERVRGWSLWKDWLIGKRESMPLVYLCIYLRASSVTRTYIHIYIPTPRALKEQRTLSISTPLTDSHPR
jgi:hypothetical protein